MDFMKVLDQTVREIKREVNLKVLKVPEIEQKVLDATNDEPWGPHGSALAELAQATKKFTECQMIMNVLWTRLTETGANWRYVYKGLTVIEYLIANGSERAIDDILEHSFRISSLSGFEYVEPNGKDAGINVRKKVETIVALINDKEKIQAVRNKAAATRDKYFGLSSTGITYKSSASSYGSSNRYGGFGSSREDDTFKDSYKCSESYGKETKSKDILSSEHESAKSKKGTLRHSGSRDSLSSNSSKTITKPGPVLSSRSPSVEPNISEDDFDDFNPRGSSTGGSANTTSNQVDLFGESLVDLMDAPTSSPSESATFNKSETHEVDLFADATFVSAPPHAEATTVSHDQANIDLFASQPAFPAPVSTSADLFGASDSVLLSSEPKYTATFDPFAAPDSGMCADTKSSTSEPTNKKSFDPFAAIPLSNFEESDSFGAFTSNTGSTMQPHKNVTNSLSGVEQTSLASSKPATKDTFQVKSGIWADSLSRGLIDLNIAAPMHHTPHVDLAFNSAEHVMRDVEGSWLLRYMHANGATKKTNLADIGIIGGVGGASEEKEKGPATAWYMAHAMGAGSGMGRSGLSSSTATQEGGSFSTFGQQQHGGFK